MFCKLAKLWGGLHTSSFSDWHTQGLGVGNETILVQQMHDYSYFVKCKSYCILVWL